MTNEGMIQMRVAGIVLDPTSSMPIVILRDSENRRTLPIWVGMFEARAIALELEGVGSPRPLTHDLMKQILDSLGAKVTKIFVHALRDKTFYAKVCLARRGGSVQVDARPSDAIALALRTKSPIYVSEGVLSNVAELGRFEEEQEPEKLKRFLENLGPDDFGKYKM